MDRMRSEMNNDGEDSLRRTYGYGSRSRAYTWQWEKSSDSKAGKILTELTMHMHWSVLIFSFMVFSETLPAWSKTNPCPHLVDSSSGGQSARNTPFLGRAVDWRPNIFPPRLPTFLSSQLFPQTSSSGSGSWLWDLIWSHRGHWDDACGSVLRLDSACLGLSIKETH